MSNQLSHFNPIAKHLSKPLRLRPHWSLAARGAAWFFLILALWLAVLFLTAGTWSYWQGWVFLGIIFLPNASGYLYFYWRDPELLERRLRSKETVAEQALLIRWIKLFFLAAFMLPGFDHRFAWSRSILGNEPIWLALISQAMALAGMSLVMWVMGVNRYAGRTIQVDAGQTVIATGPYRFVRHPMYAGGTVLLLFAPLALGSTIAIPAFLLLLPFFAVRLLNEEKVLRAELPGYTEYCQQTRFRLIPFVW
jgi:protein-S-isoprenylcysteine O-methyltransferase Ste14